MASIFVREAKFQMVLLFLPGLVAVMATMLFPLVRSADASTPYFWLGLVGMLAGYAMLVRSKWSQVRKGDLFSWGLAPDARHMRPLYVASYLTMVGGFFLASFSGLF